MLCYVVSLLAMVCKRNKLSTSVVATEFEITPGNT